MLQRYDYEDPKAFGRSGDTYIFDRTRGCSRNAAVAICPDKDQAQRIVDLLNASEVKATRKEPKP